MKYLYVNIYFQDFGHEEVSRPGRVQEVRSRAGVEKDSLNSARGEGGSPRTPGGVDGSTRTPGGENGSTRTPGGGVDGSPRTPGGVYGSTRTPGGVDGSTRSQGGTLGSTSTGRRASVAHNNRLIQNITYSRCPNSEPKYKVHSCALHFGRILRYGLYQRISFINIFFWGGGG